MTEQHYLIILDALAEKLKAQVETNKYQALRIELLEQRLKEAEKHIEKEI